MIPRHTVFGLSVLLAASLIIGCEQNTGLQAKKSRALVPVLEPGPDYQSDTDSCRVYAVTDDISILAPRKYGDPDQKSGRIEFDNGVFVELTGKGESRRWEHDPAIAYYAYTNDKEGIYRAGGSLESKHVEHAVNLRSISPTRTLKGALYRVQNGGSFIILFWRGFCSIEAKLEGQFVNFLVGTEGGMSRSELLEFAKCFKIVPTKHGSDVTVQNNSIAR